MTLTDAVFWAKRGGLVLIAVIVLYIPLRLVFLILQAQGPILPPDTDIPYASQGYGTLPEVPLSSLKLEEEADPVFFLETAAGEFPDITPVAQVYRLPEKQQTLTALDKAKSFADKFKFTEDFTRIPNTSKYQWVDTYGRILTYDLSTQNFDLVTDFEKDVYELKSLIPELETAEKQARSFLEGLDLLDSSYKEGFIETQFLKFGPQGEFLIANSQVEAELIRIDFFRTTTLKALTEEQLEILELYEDDELKLNPEDVPRAIHANVRTQDIIKSDISLIIRGSNFNKVGEIYQMEYNFWQIDEEKTETYYVKNPAEAWEDVKNGDAYLRYLVSKEGEAFKDYIPINVSEFLVYDMSVVYLETKEYQSYLQPVYMVSGEARTLGNTGKPDLDFVFMTPAIKKY